MPDPWSSPKTRIENLIRQPGTQMSTLLQQNPAEIEIEVDVRERVFDRRGYIDCERWVAKVSDDPCKLVAGHNATPHSATVRMTEEEIREVSNTMSARLNLSMSQSLSTTVGSRAGVPGSEVSISGTSASTMGGGIEFVTSETVARRIRSALEVAETIGLDAHVPQLCKKWRVPYGLELVVTVRGRAKVRRRWLQRIQDPTTIEWSDQVTVDLSGTRVDASVDPGIDTATSFMEDAPCATCADGSRLELGEDGIIRRVAGPRERGGTKEKGAKTAQRKKKGKAGKR